MIDPYSADSLLRQKVITLDDEGKIAEGHIVKFVDEENVWLISINGRMKKKIFSEDGLVVSFFKNPGPVYETVEIRQLVSDKFVITDGRVAKIELPVEELNGLSIGGITVLMNGTGIIMS